MEEFPKLINQHDGSVININNSSFSVGRSLSCDHIIQSLGVSRFHCIIKKSGEKWTLFDRSTNGTRVNSTLHKFNESVDLKHGDVIKLGPDNLDFVFTHELSKTTSKSHSTNEEDTTIETVTIEDSAEVLEDVVIDEFQKPFELEGPITQPASEEKKPADQNLEIMENELTCSICSELFVKAVTLSCSHSYCKFCIEQWKKSKSTCPICRKPISTIAPTLVLDNFIEKFVSTQSEEVKETRKTLIKQREEAVESAASSSSHHDDSIIEIYTEDDDDDDDDEDHYEDSDYNYSDEDFDMYDSYFDGGSRPYYGGYGKCFICNQAGHWANSCPFKRR